MAKAATNVVQGSGTNGWIMKRERSVWSAQATEIGRLREIACFVLVTDLPDHLFPARQGERRWPDLIDVLLLKEAGRPIINTSRPPG